MRQSLKPLMLALALSLLVHALLFMTRSPVPAPSPEVTIALHLAPAGAHAPAAQTVRAETPSRRAPKARLHLARPAQPATITVPNASAKPVVPMMPSTQNPNTAQAPGPARNAPPTGGAGTESTVTPPRFLGDADHPPYPERSRQLGEQGRVVLKVKVGVDGQVLDVVLLRSSGYPQLDASAMQWLRQGPFIPARRGQQAIVSWWNTGVVYNVSSAQ